jgi:succinate-semialdehyde dehydrogenase/glutarate-semialdehyde dehydrogenase
MKIESVNPATGEVNDSYEVMTARQSSNAIRAVARAWPAWRATSIGERAQLMRKAAALLRERSPQLAHLMAVEMGKPLSAGRSEAEKCAWG